MARLTVGMATYDDFDGPYFTIQAIRLGQDTGPDEVDFLVVDNHPAGPVAQALRDLAAGIPGVRYVPFAGYTGTAVRDLVFRYATTEYVMCVDSHVLLAPGSLRALLDYFAARPGCRDLVQGPMLSDPLGNTTPLTHHAPRWDEGLWGVWASDPRGADPAGEPFVIGMQGLGVFACRRDCWPGLNPRLRGHGGEEGYLHEKIRRAGGQVVCHPAIRWVHRFARPGGISYQMAWLDRARNYLIAFTELGWDTGPVQAHLREYLGITTADLVLARARRETSSPFAVFDAVFCLHPDDSRPRWDQARDAFAALQIDWLAEPVLIPPAAGQDPEHTRELAHRALIAQARQRGLASILLIDDRAVLDPAALSELRRALTTPPAPGWRAWTLTSHARAVSQIAYSQYLTR
jgi:hypothetical protein